MYLLYNILIIVAGVLLLPLIVVKIIIDPRYRCGIGERLGFVPVRNKSGRRFLVHASSVGEVNVACPFIHRLKDEFGDVEVVLSVMTPEGYKLANEKLAGAAEVVNFCLDYRSFVKRFLRRIDPDAIFIMETEIWPNFLRAAEKRGITVGVINGRISANSYKNYRRVKSFIKSALRGVSFFLVQEDEYRERLVRLTGESERVKVVGNIKFDIDRTFFKIDEALLEKVIGLDYIVAASTHDDEEARVLAIFSEVRAAFGDLKLVIAPRHVKRCDRIEAQIVEKGFSCIKRSEINGAGLEHYDVILVDTIGDLVTFFKSAKVVFMGGSLVDVGGHNILEPAYFSRAVIFGQHMHNFNDAKALIMSEGGAVEVGGDRELKEKLIELLNDESLRERLGEGAKRALNKSKGALKKTVDHIRSVIA